MSWWDVGSNVIGDGPADQLSIALKAISARRRPSLGELLSNMSRVLQESGYSHNKITAVLDRGASVASDAAKSEDAAMESLSEALGAIGEQYRQRFQRRPTIDEILETLLFVLGPDPGRYVSDSEKIKSITAGITDG